MNDELADRDVTLRRLEYIVVHEYPDDDDTIAEAILNKARNDLRLHSE